MIKREIKKILIKSEIILQPVLLVMALSVFLLSTLAFINLSPKYITSDKNVLGVSDKKEVGVVLVGGTHNYINNEGLSFNEDKSFTYTFNINNRESGIISKPSLEITNDSSEEIKVKINSFSSSLTQSDIILKYKSSYLVLINSVGAQSNPTLTIPAQSKDIIYISVENTQPIRYSQEVTISFTTIK